MNPAEELKEEIEKAEKWQRRYEIASSPSLEIQIGIATAKAILAEMKRLKDGIELAIGYLPECPDKAKSFLEGALLPEPKPCQACKGSGKEYKISHEEILPLKETNDE